MAKGHGAFDGEPTSHVIICKSVHDQIKQLAKDKRTTVQWMVDDIVRIGLQEIQKEIHETE
jgi:hypothetical protein